MNAIRSLEGHYNPAFDLHPESRRTNADFQVHKDSTPALCLQDVNYHVIYRAGPWWKGACFRKRHVKHVLRDVNLLFPAGQLIGLVGSSGSGKTSLLDVIAYRADGVVKGKLTYSGFRCTKTMMRQRVSYVIQADRLLPNLTVKETLTYTAYLKLPSDVTKKQLEEKVDNVINRMGLRGVANSRVGGAVVRGISGGEKRRVTIALQLLKDPEILLLDEPTTGLDSFTARHLVANLQEIARHGKIVVLSLHQPRSDITKLLDQTALMSRGHVMYYGPTSNLTPYFTQLGYPCPTYANPLDTYIDLVSIDGRDPERLDMTSHRSCELLEAYLSSEVLAHTKAQIAESAKARSFTKVTDSKLGSSGSLGSPGWTRVFFTVLARMNLNLSRDHVAYVNRLITLPLFVPFIIIFLGRLKHNQGSIQDRIGLLYNSVQVPPYMGIINNVAIFPVLRDHFYREGQDGLYGPQTFLLAYTLHILPFVVFSGVAFSSILYWSSGMYPDLDRFGMHVAVVILLHMVGELFTCAVMGLFRNPQLANTVMALTFTATGLLSSGFIRSLQNMAEILRYLSWVTVHKYASEIVVANEFHNLTLTCDQQLQGLPCVPNGDVFIDANYPGATIHIQRNFALLTVLLIGIQILAIVFFKVFGLRVMQ